MCWFYKDKEFNDEDISDNVAFVYIITNLLNNRKYIGKKNLFFQKTKQVKLKKKRFKVPSDWPEYYGSNAELQEDVKLHGENCFRREIIRLCKTKGEASYFEARLQFLTDCVLDDMYYNCWISVRVRKSHLKNIDLIETFH